MRRLGLGGGGGGGVEEDGDEDDDVVSGTLEASFSTTAAGPVGCGTVAFFSSAKSLDVAE